MGTHTLYVYIKEPWRGMGDGGWGMGEIIKMLGRALDGNEVGKGEKWSAAASYGTINVKMEAGAWRRGGEGRGGGFFFS